MVIEPHQKEIVTTTTALLIAQPNMQWLNLLSLRVKIALIQIDSIECIFDVLVFG